MNARFEPGAATVSAQNTRVFHRHLRQDFPVAVRGEGVALFDAAGKRYIDASGGAAVSCLEGLGITLEPSDIKGPLV